MLQENPATMDEYAYVNYVPVLTGGDGQNGGALVAIVRFRDGKISREHIYRDQASVLKQIGLRAGR